MMIILRKETVKSHPASDRTCKKIEEILVPVTILLILSLENFCRPFSSCSLTFHLRYRCCIWFRLFSNGKETKQKVTKTSREIWHAKWWLGLVSPKKKWSWKILIVELFKGISMEHDQQEIWLWGEIFSSFSSFIYF